MNIFEVFFFTKAPGPGQPDGIKILAKFCAVWLQAEKQAGGIATIVERNPRQ